MSSFRRRWWPRAITPRPRDDKGEAASPPSALERDAPAGRLSPDRGPLAQLAGQAADRIVVVDCETTGVFSSDRVIEIATVTLDLHGTVIERWETLINPGRDAGPTWLHGIDGEMLAHAPAFEQVAGALAARLRGAVVAAHNLPFDTRMLTVEFERIQSPVDFGSGLDTLRATGARLGQACADYGIELAGAHRALDDAEATARLLLCVAGQLQGPTRPAWTSDGLPVSARTVRRGELRATITVQVPPPPFLAGAAATLTHQAEDNPAVVGYLEVLDRALANLHIDAHEAAELVAFAEEHGLGDAARRQAHHRYLDELIDDVLADHEIHQEEYEQLVRIAAALSLDQDVVHRRTRAARFDRAAVELRAGLQVCFTGEVDGLPRSQLTAHADRLGLQVAKNVTKQTDLLVAADRSSESGKAEKARRYGIPIASADAFAQTRPDTLLEASVAAIERLVAFTCQACQQTWTMPARSARRRGYCDACRHA